VEDPVRLSGTVVLVTGASSGVGAATAELLAARGARVVAHGRNPVALADLVARTGALSVVADLSEPAAAARLARDCVELCGHVDVLVANAGIGHAADVSGMDDSTIDALVATNLTAPIQLTRALLPTMLARRLGALVYVTSIAGRTGVAGEAVYAATKAGLDAFAESLRLELRGTGVSVGVCVPGVVATAFFDRRGRPYGRARPRPMPPGTVAAAVVRLIEGGEAELYRPRWLRLPVAVRAVVPAIYRWLAGRFGGS
jgi:short-subunit dehydrogenase